MNNSTSDGETIDTTTNHPFYVEDKGWVAAGDLEIGDTLVTIDGDEVEVTDIEIEKLAEPILVYNLEIEDFHTYFVGEYGVLVHNNCLGNNMKKSGNYPPQDGQKYNAHHIFPQKFRDFFESIGLNIDDARFGIWLEQHEHLTNFYSYNKMWEEEINILKNLSGIDMDQEFFRFIRELTRLW